MCSNVYIWQMEALIKDTQVSRRVDWVIICCALEILQAPQKRKGSLHKVLVNTVKFKNITRPKLYLTREAGDVTAASEMADESGSPLVEKTAMFSKMQWFQGACCFGLQWDTKVQYRKSSLSNRSMCLKAYQMSKQQTLRIGFRIESGSTYLLDYATSTVWPRSNVIVFIFSPTGLKLVWKFSLDCRNNAIAVRYLLCPSCSLCFVPVVWTGSLTFPHSWMSEQWCHTSCSQRPGQQSGDRSNQTQRSPHLACIKRDEPENLLA